MFFAFTSDILLNYLVTTINKTLINNNIYYEYDHNGHNKFPPTPVYKAIDTGFIKYFSYTLVIFEMVSYDRDLFQCRVS